MNFDSIQQVKLEKSKGRFSNLELEIKRCPDRNCDGKNLTKRDLEIVLRFLL
jgi:hypothetical protein